MLLERFGENLKHKPRQAICMEKTLETAWVVLKIEQDSASGNHQSGVNSRSQVNGISDMAPASCFCGGRAH